MSEKDDFHHTTAGRQMPIVIGPTSLSCIGPVVATYVGAVCEHHSQPRHLYKPESIITWTSRHIEATGLSVSLTGASVSLYLGQLDASLVHIALRLATCELKKWTCEQKHTKIEIFQMNFYVSITNIFFPPIFLRIGTTVSVPLCLAPNSICL